MHSNHGPLSRRALLGVGAGAAGGWLAGSWRTCRAAGHASGRVFPDRSKDAPTAPVGIRRCPSYEPATVRAALESTLRLVCDLPKLVAGKSVAVKMNLTGGPGKLAGLPAQQTYHVHPKLVAALCGVLHDAGARRIVLLESQYSNKRPEDVLGPAGWDISAIKSAGGQTVTFEDTRNRGRWPKYSRLPVPWGGYMYPAFDLNQSYEKNDVFISLAKLKDHATAGVTMAVKNLFGIPPTSLYGATSPDENCLSARMEVLHFASHRVPDGVPGEVQHGGPDDPVYRVPRITADLMGARPIDLAIVDGVQSNRGGEGPWVVGVEALQPRLLLAGCNAVCTDAVCTAVMGYDPQSPHYSFPFPGDNHLRLLAQVGVGTNDPRRIEVRGLSVAEARFPFNPRRLPFNEPLPKIRAAG